MGGWQAAIPMLVTPDVMRFPDSHQPRLTKARAKLDGRRLLTSVMVIPVIVKHRVHRVIMMMVIRRIQTMLMTTSCGSMLMTASVVGPSEP